jgi:hypothetical protein
LHLTIPYELVFEQGEPPSGQAVRQKYTDLWANDECYIYYHDHDSLISPEVCDYLNKNLDFIEPKIYMFGQIWFVNGLKWTNDYHNDGIFISQLFDLHSDSFVFENDINAYYNALMPNKGLYNGQIITIV